jgi:hypothetical protein
MSKIRPSSTTLSPLMTCIYFSTQPVWRRPTRKTSAATAPSRALPGAFPATPPPLLNENGQLTWWILDSSNGAKHNIPFGQSGDIPVP